MSQLDTKSSLTNKQQIVLDCLLSRGPDESLTDVANRAKVSRMTLHRLMRDRTFLNEYKQSIADELSASRGQARHVITELTRIAFSDVRRLFDEDGHLLPAKSWSDFISAAVSSIEVVNRKSKDGSGDMEYIKRIKLWDKNHALRLLAKYFDLITDSVEISGPGGGPIEINNNVSVDQLPLYVRQLLVLVSNGKELDSDLQERLKAALGPMFGEFLAERRELIAAGSGGGEGEGMNRTMNDDTIDVEASDYSVDKPKNSSSSGKKKNVGTTIDLESI